MAPPSVYKLAEGPVQRSAKGLWTWDASVTRMGFPTRMVVLGYDAGDGHTSLIVIAPLAPEEHVVAWLRQLGDVKFILAPNLNHRWWAPAMKAAFPSAMLLGPAALKEKDQEGVFDGFVDSAADLPGSWPLSDVPVIKVEGIPTLEELALVHTPSKTLIITDLAFNFTRSSEAHTNVLLPVRWYLALAGGHRRCCVTTTFKWLISDPGAAKLSCEELLTHDFDAVCMAHGEYIADDGKRAFMEGSYAFICDLHAKRTAAAKQGGQRDAVLGVTAAAGAVAMAGIGIGVVALMRTRQGASS